MEIKYHIGKRIKEFRDQFGISQKDLASQLGINQGPMSKYERGLLSVPDEIKLKLSHLGISLLWLLDGDGPMLRKDLKLAPREPEEEIASNEYPEEVRESPAQSYAAENPESMGMVMTQLNLIQSMLEEKGQLPKEESGHCPVCATYWKLNEKNQAKVIGYTECLLEEQFKSVDYEEDDSNSAQNAG